VRLNRLDEARQVLAEARRIRPQLSLGEIKRFFGTRAAADLSAVWNLEREPNPSPKSH
jgi:hypothetical protein